MHAINSELEDVVDLEPYVTKLLEAKKKVIVINSMLQVKYPAKCVDNNLDINFFENVIKSILSPFVGRPASLE